MTQRRGSLGGFGLLWASQLVSLVGSSLTGFVLGVWVYQRTGSATQFAIISLAAVLPSIVVAPFAGVLADRRDRRMIMVVADLGAGAATAAIATLIWTGNLQVWHIYVSTAVAAIFTVAHSTAFYATMPRVVPPEHLGRANGLMQMVQAAQIAAPVLAAVLLAAIGLRGVVLVDLATMLVGVTLLLTARLPRGATAPAEAGARVTLGEDLTHGWRYLRERPGLLQLALVFGAFNCCFAFAGVLVQPLILSFATVEVLGVLMLVGGAGLFVGSLVMATWGGPKRRVRGIIWFLALGGVAVVAHAARPSPWLIAVVAPLFLFTLPVLNGTTMTLVQRKVAPESLGRVIATVRMIGSAATPLAFALAGPLTDRLAEPAMEPGGALAGSFGRLIGTGDGRGIALVYLGIGLGLLVLAGVAATRPRLRGLEHELADASSLVPAERSDDRAADPAP